MTLRSYYESFNTPKFFLSTTIQWSRTERFANSDSETKVISKYETSHFYYAYHSKVLYLRCKHTMHFYADKLKYAHFKEYSIFVREFEYSYNYRKF